MRRTEAIRLLTREAGALKKRGATALFLFGSTADDTATATSDLDLFVDVDPGCFSLVDLVAIKRHLEEQSGASIDLTTRDALHPLLRDGIERSSVRVF